MVQVELVRAGIAAGLLSLACVASVGAQERITPDDFLDIANGRTLTFQDLHSGSVIGIEEYLTRKLSVWKDRSGRCVYGQITIEDGQLCFLYDDDRDGIPVCWWTFRDGDRLLVHLADLVDRQIQIVTEISDDTLDCPTVPSA